MKRLSLAFRCFFSLLFTGTISETLLGELSSRIASRRPAGSGVAPSAAAEHISAPVARLPTSKPTLPDGAERAVQVLALLQRDARLVDFFAEDIAAYDDAQVGAAVRDLHASCKTTLDRYFTLLPVIAGEEGAPITVDRGFDPGTIKLIGSVTGTLPARGVLRHHGWKADLVRLPDLPEGAVRSVIAPAEVEIG